jgi:hypothetical protein
MCCSRLIEKGYLYRTVAEGHDATSVSRQPVLVVALSLARQFHRTIVAAR